MSALGRMWSHFRIWQLRAAARWWEREAHWHRASCFNHREAALHCASRAQAHRTQLFRLEAQEERP